MKSPDPGLCRGCQHAHVVVSGRGSSFWRCKVHDVEPSWPKYPPLPVLRCARFAANAGTGGDGGLTPPPNRG